MVENKQAGKQVLIDVQNSKNGVVLSKRISENED